MGTSLALASRLINKSLFETPVGRASLVSGLLAANAETQSLIILLAAPSTFKPDPAERTSVTEAWRDSVYHITTVSPWNWNATLAEKKAHYKLASSSIDHLRAITPDAAYLVSKFTDLWAGKGRVPVGMC